MPNNQESNKKETVQGFAKGWVIFMIVYASAAGLSVARYLTNSTLGGIMALFMLFCGVMVTGLALLLKKKAYGLWILLAGSALITAMSGMQADDYIVLSSGGLVLTGVTWLVTRKQIRYFGGRKRDAADGNHDGPQGPAMPQYIASGKTPDPTPADPPAALPLSEDTPEIQMPARPGKPEPEAQAKAAQPGSAPNPISQSMPAPAGQAASDAGAGRQQPPPVGTGRRLGPPIIIGIAAFAVVVAGLFLLIFLKPHASTASLPVGQTQELTADQQALLDDLAQKLPGALEDAAKQFTQDPLFLSAVAQAKLGDCAFDGNTLNVTVLLPDPRAENLNRLGIADYAAHSGAQAYIHDNYPKLRAMEGLTDYVAYRTQLFPQDLNGVLTLDWSLPGLTAVPYDYEQVFTPHVAEYMKDKGFYTAALELLMPDFQSWDRHTGAERDAAQLEEYFQSLAQALSSEGITVDRKTVVDVDTIKRALKTRLMNTWAFDSPGISAENYRTMLTVRTVEPIAVFQNASDELGAQYKAGAKAAPADYKSLEAAYLEHVRGKINALYGSDGLPGPEAAYDRQYVFNWEELGEKGVAACPELVNDIRLYLFNYDFDLLFLADPIGVKTP